MPSAPRAPGHRPPWRRDNFTWLSDIFTDIYYGCVDAVWAAGKYYLACYDGGLVGWDYDADEYQVFLLGKDSGYALNTFPPEDTLLGIGGRANRVVAIDAVHDDSAALRIAVATRPRVWLFTPDSVRWDTLSVVLGEGEGQVDVDEKGLKDADANGARSQRAIGRDCSHSDAPRRDRVGEGDLDGDATPLVGDDLGPPE